MFFKVPCRSVTTYYLKIVFSDEKNRNRPLYNDYPHELSVSFAPVLTNMKTLDNFLLTKTSIFKF